MSKPRKNFIFTLTSPNEGIASMLKKQGHVVFDQIKTVTDIVLFPGGADVSPFFYGEKRFPKTRCDMIQDLDDAKAYRRALSYGLPMIGICRGAQFLHVMNGGSLWQDVNNHATSKGHVINTKDNQFISVTSTHHQMMRGIANGEAIAWSNEATMKVCQQDAFSVSDKSHNEWEDLEVIWHKDTKSLCFQPHPEYHIKECHDYFFKLVKEYVVPAVE